MNLRQLRALCEIVDGGLLLTQAANRTCRSQSSVTRQIQALEAELQIQVFERGSRKLLQLTPAGEQILVLARRMVRDAEGMLNIGRNTNCDETGTLTVATTNFYARYALPSVIRKFIQKHRHVRLSLRHGTPAQCCELVASGKADVGVCAAGDVPQEVVRLPCYRVPRTVLTPADHPLLGLQRLTLKALAKYPLITFDEAYRGSVIVNKMFTDNGLHPTIVLSAADADVTKLYVGMGLGIGILASVAFDPALDVSVRGIPAQRLFPPSHLSMTLRRDYRCRHFVYDFMQMFAPHIEREMLEDVSSRKLLSAASADLPELSVKREGFAVEHRVGTVHLAG